MKFDYYQASIDYIFSQLPMFQRVGAVAYKADLINTYAMLQILDNPHQKFKSIHIAGTNGKGSTANMLSAILQAEGYKTGLYTSPHLIDFRERIRLNGEMIPQEYVLNFINQYVETFEKIKPTFFEWTVALCFQYFADTKVDFAVIETGLGGRLDSTNVIQPELSIITNIGMDHVQLLGDTLEKIAGEKAGIIKANTPVLISTTQEEIKHVFINKAQTEQAPIRYADQEYSFKILEKRIEHNSIEITNLNSGNVIQAQTSLIGNYQPNNTIGVIAAIDELRKLGHKIQDSSIQKGLKHLYELTQFTGRWRVHQTQPLVVFDTGHNVDGIRYVVEQIKEYDIQQLHWVLGMVSDKSIDEVLNLLPKHGKYYLCQANIPRALAKEELANQVQYKKLNYTVYDSVALAYQSAIQQASKEDMVLVAGSTFTVAEVLKHFNINT
jgi:dihydrofolate synthase / folylpolyglutamate synthase